MTKARVLLFVSALAILDLLASLLIPGGPKPSQDPNSPASVEWELLAKLKKDSESPASLAKLENSIVRIPGFMIPLDYNQREVREFLFVPNLPACVHVPPPPPNQTIYVKMTGQELENTYEPFWVTGRLKISKSARGDALYEMEGLNFEPYKNP